MAEEAVGRVIGDQLPTSPDQRLEKFAARAAAKIERDRPLGPVEVLPIERMVAGGDRPAVLVRAAADLIDPDHTHAHLRAVQPG